MHLKREVSGDGPVGEILVIGEAPGREELVAGKPFVGPSGKILRKYCAQVGIEKVRFENVVEYKLPDNNEGVLYYDPHKSLPTEEHQAWRADLKKRIALIKPKAIVVCGDTALRAITDHSAIGRVHCYVLRDSLDVSAPIIPAYHPAYILRQRSNAYWLKFALRKAREVAEGKDDPPFNTIVHNDPGKTAEFLRECALAKEVCIDIETLKDKEYVTAIGISKNPDEAISFSRSGLEKEEWEYLVGMIKVIMEDPRIGKIGQNFTFDSMMLWKCYGMKCRGPVWDTMHAANVIYSDLKKSLEEQGRLWTYRAPWKGGWNSTGEKLRIYNAQDVIITHRIKEKQEEEMRNKGIFDYFQTPKALFVPALEMSLRGIRVDTALKEKLTIEVEEALQKPYNDVIKWAAPYLPMGEKKKKKRDPLSDQLTTIEGITLNPKIKRDVLNEQLVKAGIPKKEAKDYYIAKKKDEQYGHTLGQLYKKAYREEVELYKRDFNPGSPSQLEAVLRNAEVKLPKVKQQHTKKWEESTNEKALKKIIERGKDPDDVIEFVKNMLIIRHGNKLVSSYCKAALDEDNRWRCSYNIEGTETGRSSSRKTPWSTGGNNQNIPRDGFRGVKFKKVFIPDEGMTLFQSDQGQAEARIVAYLANCKKLIELFEHNEDIHVYAINSILGEDIRGHKDYKFLRQCGKFINHGGNYDMGATTLSEQALKAGVDIPVKKAEFFLAKRRQVFPEIYEWHKSIQEQLQKDRTLYTPFGRRRIFFGKIDNAMFREAYAHIPQSTIPHITNLMWLNVENSNWVKDGPVNVLQMGHDALLMQVKDDKLKGFVSWFLDQTKTIKFDIGNYNVTIPWDAGVGKNWGELEDMEV